MTSTTIDRILQITIALGLVALIAVVGTTMQEQVTKEGDDAPEFSILTDSGVTVSTSNFGGKVLVLNFWATWCPPCIDEMPSLSQLHQQMNDQGVVVLGISVDEDPIAYQNFVTNHGVSFLTARDPAAKISADYGTFRYPETYIITADGKVAQKVVGQANWTDPQMIGYIKSLL
jgi:cytochrome c biogenesis protein CcmG, thiol:disulfide interchange protein DsbE